MRRVFFTSIVPALATLSGCSTASWESSITATGDSISAGANSVWVGAGKLWPAGVWPDGIWVADYERAEQLAAETGKGSLILLTQKDRTREDSVRSFLEDPAARGVASDYIPVLLFQNNEPDRRYAAQFGVNRAPGVIVLHPDGTFHATQGSLNPEMLTVFLSESSPPGATPTINPLVARRQGYSWYRDWASARQASEASGKPVFVVLERWMSRDWDSLQPMIERREVYLRTTGMIHCRPSTAWSTSTEAASQLGIKNLPAVAIVPSDGQGSSILELPTSYEAIVRFIDQAKQPTVTDAQP